MIEVFKKIWKFAGKEQGNIKKSILLGFINAMFYAIQFGAIFVVLDGLLKEEKSTMTALTALRRCCCTRCPQAVTLCGASCG